MQVSSAGDSTEHMNDWRESARTDHCQTSHRGRRMMVSLPSRNPIECFSSRLPQVVHRSEAFVKPHQAGDAYNNRERIIDLNT